MMVRREVGAASKCSFQRLTSIAAVLLGFLFIGQAGWTKDIYTFESLNVNNLIHGQDNWIDQPGQGQAAIYQDPGSINGTKVARHVPTVVFNQSAFLTRVNDGNFSFPAVTEIQTGLTIQFDCNGQHVAIFALGHDVNGDGMLKSSEGEIGPSFGTYDRDFRLQGANLGTIHNVDFGSGNNGTDWYRIQLRIDFTANDGDGSGSLYYKNLTDGDPDFIAVSGLQDIDLELGAMDPGAKPTTWDALWMHLLTGGGNIPHADDLVPVEDATFCQKDIGFGGPGDARFSLCGGDLSSGTTADLLLTGAPEGKAALLLISDQNNPTPFAGGLVVPFPYLISILLTTNNQGEIFIPGLPGGGGPAMIYAQFIYEDPAQTLGFGISNALEVVVLN